MAMQTYVFMKQEKIPNFDELQTAINNEGFDYVLPESFNIQVRDEDFIEGKFEGLESCFDYIMDAYGSGDWEWTEEDQEIIGEPEVLSVFNTHSNAQEIVGMIIVSSVLAKISGGTLLSEFFSEEVIKSEDCIEFAKDIVEGSRDQFSGPSKMR